MTDISGGTLAVAPDASRFVVLNREAAFVRIVALAGSSVQTVTAPSGYVFGGGMAWSPSGEFVACVLDRAPHVMQTNSIQGKLVLLRAGTATFQTITGLLPALNSPAWSPDGKYVTFVTRDGVDVVRVRDHHVSVLVPMSLKNGVGSIAMDPAWSPRQDLVAFTRLAIPAATSTLEVVPALGGATKTLATGCFGPSFWMPDGARLLYSEDVAGRHQICWADTAGSANHVVSSSDVNETVGGCSADGGAALAVRLDATRRGRSELIAVALPSGRSTVLVTGPGSVWATAWVNQKR